MEQTKLLVGGAKCAQNKCHQNPFWSQQSQLQLVPCKFRHMHWAGSKVLDDILEIKEVGSELRLVPNLMNHSSNASALFIGVNKDLAAGKIVEELPIQ